MVKKVKNNDGIEVVVDDLLTKEGEVEDIDTEEVMEDINEDSNADDSVIIDTESLEVNEDPVLDGDVRIRMRIDHNCAIAGVRYELKQDKTYTVPQNVKSILNKAGYLIPLA